MQKNQQSSNLSQSQQQFLQPISKFNPPNDIITKNYSLDQKPILKLMRLDKVQGTCQQLKNKYKSLFSSQDTLGYQYSYSLCNQIVFLKFNNHNYMKYKIKGCVYKFLAGMFLPIDRIVCHDVRMSKNVYKTLPDIQYVEYKNNIQDSFAKNTRQVNLKTLKFSSNYQSANLFIAMKKKQYQYDLIIQNDINSKGNTQWFNFAVQFSQQGTYKFNILNFTKSNSQYEDGMRIVYYSYKDQQSGIGGWVRGCTNIRYQETCVKREDADFRNYYSLSFQYMCGYPSDKVIFAYFYPYTALDLEKFMKKTLYRKLNVHMKMEKIKICQTLSGLPVYVISIKNKKNNKQQPHLSSPPKNLNAPPPKTCKSVVFMARQHSGQSQGSFVTEGIIDIIMQNGQIDYLKKNIQFYIFPMINMDGVLYGNYRTNLSGTDLNRIWRNPKKQLHPEVYYTKKYMQIINKTSPISLIVDIHGHSKSLNSFFYGNPPRKDILTGFTEDPRLFPYVCSKKIKQISFLQSTFSITEDKKNSARVVLSQFFPKAQVYTLQNSFHGWRKDHNAIHEYTPQILRKIGRQLVITYLQFDKLCQKNPQIKQKWGKQIIQLKLKNDLKEQVDLNGDSDSQAQMQLIDLDQQYEKMSFLDGFPERSLLSSSNNLMDILKKQNKQNFVQRNLIIKTQIHQRNYNKYNRRMITGDTSHILKPKRQSNQIKFRAQTSGEGFLSIIKIKTPTQSDQLGAKLSEESMNSDQRRKKDMNFNKQNIVQKLKRKKIRIQQAVSSSTGMKTFLRTMGIPLQKKYF